MGAVAASGGYYSSMGCDEIIALPGTITGSIGVLAGKFVARETYEKLGLIREGIEGGPHAGMLSMDRGFTEQEWDILNTSLDRIYQQFVSKAAADRGMEFDQLEGLAKGRVWTGADAHERGLIDHLGGVETALGRASELARIDRDKAVLRPLGHQNLLARLQPVNSSESASVSLQVPEPLGVEGLIGRAMKMLGLETLAGPLQLPYDVTMRC